MQFGIGKTSLSYLSYAASALILFLLVGNPFVSIAQAQTNSASTSQYADHGFAALAAGDRVTLNSLEDLTGGNLTVGAFEQVIQSVFLPLNLREVLLDIGWQNFTAGSPPYQAWVSNWFTASDVMGISNVLYVGQLTAEGFGSPWVDSLISKDSSAATYYANGTSAAYVSLDNPEVAHYLEIDLGVLYSYYGMYTSWVGLGTGSSDSNPYYSESSTVPIVGYSNLSISSFVNSPYYNSVINATGYLPNGQLDDLWSEYRNVQPGIVLSSGLWMTSTAYQVYGSGSLSSYVEMRFDVPSNTTTLQMQWYGNEVGSPGKLNVTIFGDNNGLLDSSERIASVNASTSSFTTSVGWQSDVQVAGNFTAGWYWVVFSSPSSNESNNYNVYLKDYLINNATAYTQQGSIGPGLQLGSTILWLKNQAGQNLTIYPYQEAYVGAPPQEFTATSAYTFNTVFLWLSDRAYNTANATISIYDTTTDRLVATGLLSQALIQGLLGWVPIALNGSVTTVAGNDYQLTVSDPSVTWITAMRYVTTDPPQAGFQNQSATLLFELGNVEWTQGVMNWGEFTDIGNDAVTTGQLDAVRFSPNYNETLTSVQILMDSPQGGGGNYSSGTMSVAIWGSSTNDSAPEGLVQELSVPATLIPRNGMLNVTGFSASVTAGNEYWIVFSTSSTDRFTFARLTNSFSFLVRFSDNNGTSWTNPGEGPTDYAFTVGLSRETLGTFVAGQVTTALTSDSILAQPFVASSNSSVEGVYIGPLIGEGPLLLVSITPTGGNGDPAASPLGSGTYDAGNITVDYSPEFVQFSSVVHLQKGDEYWITITPIGAGYKVNSLTYLDSDPYVPANSSALVSDNDGLSWDRVSNMTNGIPDYLLESAPSQPPQYDTQELANDLLTNFDLPVSSGPLEGWNAYVQASELSTFNSFTQWLSNIAGRQFEFYTNAQANVADQLSLKNIVVLPAANSTSSCQALLSAEESGIASGGGQFTYAPLSKLQQCSSEGVTALAQQLNYLPYVGTQFGLGTSNNVLVVGDGPTSNLTGYLSNAFNATYVNLSLDPNLKVQGNLSSFKAILWISSSNVTSSSVISTLLSQYVRKGGELVTTDASLASLSSFKPVLSKGAPAIDASSFLQTALVHTVYANDSFQETVSSATISARSANLNISLAILGAGKLVYIGFGASSPSESGDQAVVIANVLSNALGVPAPLWYNLGDSQMPQTDAYSVEGKYGGPLLVWLYNPSSSASTLSLGLNGSYYGVPSSWESIQLPGLGVSAGSGSNVTVMANLPPETLVGILIVPRSEPLISYSSGSVQSQFAYPDQSLYSIAGTYNQSILLVISTDQSASQILLNDRTSLPQVSSAGALYNSSSGWYFDRNTDSLFVKYQSTGVDSLRFLFYAAPVPSASLVPAQDLVTILLVAIAVEAVTLAFLLLRTRRRRFDDRRRDDGRSV